MLFNWIGNKFFWLVVVIIRPHRIITHDQPINTAITHIDNLQAIFITNHRFFHNDSLALLGFNANDRISLGYRCGFSKLKPYIPRNMYMTGF